VKLSERILIGEDRIQERVAAIARAVVEDTPPGTTLSVLALLDGAFVFAADLVRRITIPVRLALVPVRSVDRGGDPSTMALPEDFPVTGAEVLVVEDILDTGRTLARVRERLLSGGARRVRIAVLLDKPARRAVPVPADYVGFTVPDVWLVGYGLDEEGLYRNLPYLTHTE
jgi:hypoxanthine phosphoribosyltransferase